MHLTLNHPHACTIPIPTCTTQPTETITRAHARTHVCMINAPMLMPCARVEVQITRAQLYVAPYTVPGARVDARTTRVQTHAEYIFATSHSAQRANHEGHAHAGRGGTNI